MRPPKCRHIAQNPKAYYFKPRGIPLTELEEVELQADEVEALRLAHTEKMYQEEAAHNMGISRATFGRILNSAHQKMAKALLEGHALKINNQKENP